MSDETPKLRLKPRLVNDTPATPTATPASANSNPPDAPEPMRPKIALRPRVDAPTPPPTTPPASSPAVPALAIVAAIPPPPGASISAEPPPLPPAPPSSATPSGKTVQKVALGLGIAGVLLFTTVGVIAYPRIMKQAEELSIASGEGPDAEAETMELDDDPIGAAESPSNVSATPPSSAAASTATRPTQSSAPAESSRSSAEIVPPEAGDFRAWVNGLKISGVRGGATPRLLVGGKSFKVGDVINADLGIVFAGYDTERRMLLFRDATGAVAERRDR